MLKNYLTIALRNLYRHQLFSIINILGLAVGICASLVIFLIVHYDLSFDRFEPHRDRIYRVVVEKWFSGTGEFYPAGNVPVPMGPAVQKELTGIELVVPFRTVGNTKVAVPKPDPGQPAVFKEQKDFIFCDTRYTDLLGYSWLSGSPQTALRQTNAIVLTEKNAALYYPGLSPANVVGRTLLLDDTVLVSITGVVRDLRGNTDFKFGAFVSLPTFSALGSGPLGLNWNSWQATSSAAQLFVRLSPGANPAMLNQQLTRLYISNIGSIGENKSSCLLQPLADLHFNARYGAFDFSRQAHKPTLYGLLVIAAILLLLACINFVNLTTAQAGQRAKEIGIRKTMGSQRIQLALQFLLETFVLTVMAAVLSVALAPLLISVFGDFIPVDFRVSPFRQPEIILFLLGLIAGVSILSGLYPALIMSAYNPVSALRNELNAKISGTRSAWLRKSLTVSQFVIAQVFIIATILVARQISYALNLDMGFRKDAILYFYSDYRGTKTQQDVLVARLRSIPGIDRVSIGDPPVSASETNGKYSFNNGKKDIEIPAQKKQGDSNYFQLYGLHMLAGNPPLPGDTAHAIIINQTLAGMLGCRNPQDAIGMTLRGRHELPVVGVVADFHQKSIHDQIKPLFISTGTNGEHTVSIALGTGPGAVASWPSTISRMEKVFQSIYPGDVFSYRFMDQTIANFYSAEKDTVRLLAWATGLAIFISCLGLLGLVVYITNQRTKEIGIRKVLGASISQIVAMLSHDFLRLVGLAILIAMPIAWWGSHKWLENFAYHADLSWWIFASGGLLLLVIALTTLCLRTFKAAAANPVKSLKTD